MSRPIYQFHYWAAPGDAITNQMRFLRRTLLAADIPARVFARSLRGEMAGEVERLENFGDPNLSADAWWLIHVSQGMPELEKVLSLPGKKALVYHNITPASFFHYDPEVARLCRQGRADLPRVVSQMDRCFADSLFNAAELKQLGAAAVELLPLFDLSEAPTLTPGARGPGGRGYELLFVGRLSPHKDQARLLDTLYHLTRSLKVPAHLTLVGRGDPIYTRYLQHKTVALGLSSQVTFLSGIDDNQLRSVYGTADAFLCMSQHEGYCIPLVEAMRQGVAVFSATTAAMAETLGEAGIQLHTQDPREIAALLAALLGDRTLMDGVRESGRQRFEALRQFQNGEEALKHLRPLAEGNL